MKTTIKLFGATCAALEYARAYLQGICGTAIQMDDCDIKITDLVRPQHGKHFEIKGNFFEGVDSIGFDLGISLARNEHGRWVTFQDGDYIDVHGRDSFHVRREINGTTEEITFVRVTREGGAPHSTRTILMG